jgi:hypothetical protein
VRNEKREDLESEACRAECSEACRAECSEACRAVQTPQSRVLVVVGGPR